MENKTDSVAYLTNAREEVLKQIQTTELYATRCIEDPDVDLETLKQVARLLLNLVSDLGGCIGSLLKFPAEETNGAE